MWILYRLLLQILRQIFFKLFYFQPITKLKLFKKFVLKNVIVEKLEPRCRFKKYGFARWQHCFGRYKDVGGYSLGRQI